MENQGDEETRIHGTARPRRLALFPLPLQGHLNPMLQLAGILHSRGFSIAIIHTRFNFPPKSNYPHFTFHPIADGLSESQVSTTAATDLLKMLQDNCTSGLRDCLGELLMSEEPVACLIVDSWWLSSKSVADSFGLPRMVLRTGNVTSFLAFSASVLLLENGYLQVVFRNRRLMAEKEGEDMRQSALWLKEKVELSLSQGCFSIQFHGIKQKRFLRKMNNLLAVALTKVITISRQCGSILIPTSGKHINHLEKMQVYR